METRYLLAACLIAVAMAEEVENNEALNAVLSGTYQFSSQLYKTVVEENSANSLVMSPLSAAAVLGMAAYGAREETKNQFRKVLHLPDSDCEGKFGFQALIDDTNNSTQNTLVLANKVFMTEKYSVKPTYTKLTGTYFRSTTQLVDFAKSEEAANIINKWVDGITKNHMPGVVHPGDLDAQTALVLVNAVYFKGQWKDEFNATYTKVMTFHVDEISVQNIPTMYRIGTYKYGSLSNLNATFIEIPYQGDQLSMVIILPNELNGLPMVEKKLQGISIADILKQGHEDKVQLYLPKFTVTSQIHFESALKKMGLTDMFTERANFSGIADVDLHVSKVVQVATIGVNENGSVATAATVTRYLLAACLIAVAMTEEVENNEALNTVLSGTYAFSSQLYKTVLEENPANSLVMSPLSAAVVLAMTAYGASGETKNQFRKVLHLPVSDCEGQVGFQALIDDTNNSTQNTLVLANKVFMTEKYSVKPSYRELTETYFRSTTQLVDFAKSEEAANIINTWVNEITKNRMPGVVYPGNFDGQTALVLVNAVYFKGQWKDEFNATYTKVMTFHVDEISVQNIPTMYRIGTYKYGSLSNLNATFIEIPYQGDELSMVIILPNELNGLPMLEKKLNGMSIADILKQGRECAIRLYLPKFTVSAQIHLESALKKTGLTDMFTKRANFSGIADADLLVSKVVQMAAIEVNEEGSVATAATVVPLENLVAPISFQINRPFWYAVITRNASLILFNGRITNPFPWTF